MAIALVGSLGAIVYATPTPAPAFGQSTTAGHLLVAWVASEDNAANVTCSNGTWTKAKGGAYNYAEVEIWYKANCGTGETAPTWTSVNGGKTCAQLGEFSGAATSSPVDQTGQNTDYGSPKTVTATAVDTAAGDLICSCALWTAGTSWPGTPTTMTDSNNSAVTAASTTSNSGTGNWVDFAYGITTQTGIVAGDKATCSLTGGGTWSAVIASFKAVAAAGGGSPALAPAAAVGVAAIPKVGAYPPVA